MTKTDAPEFDDLRDYEARRQSAIIRKLELDMMRIIVATDGAKDMYSAGQNALASHVLWGLREARLNQEIKLPERKAAA